ncbi:dTDP-4-amino-4,6-dideoxygalactose transaminase [Herbaspirillum rubrisubalbicans]|uniref:dTDP-4-amino-4,6-dideoxygalactose transaminase n=1 Tax=Herbaspirillum rubrisubalbicans TaxID=80842 RepID=UPI001559D74D|nr:dTDP-4-amino-4,6-dideoxygalactose transaminase [Herbaspirillum rubrisubalbicans]NQE51268.1 TDP-4-oxo-6-deoxy-D-glucose aminotransferase [Herbaspirillum rubrisubalbicans]
MNISRIPYCKPFIIGKELFYMAQAVMNGSISGDGAFTQRCHQWLESQLGCAKALLTHSCTAALEMAAILADIGPGDEVIMPSFTFVSTANAFVLRGGVPVFVDIRPDTLNIDENLVEAAITPRTKAVVAVHYAGQPCNMRVLKDICERHGLMLIEDAAQAILSRDGEQALGAIGDLGCLSFHETKNIISGEGGALLINNPRLIERAEVIWQKGTNRKAFFRGQVDKYTWVDVGSSFLPSELTAAFLFAQLEQAKRINTHRRMLYDKYNQLLMPLAASGAIGLPEMEERRPENAHIFYIICRNIQERTALIKYLDERQISAVFHYVPLHDSPAGQRYARSHGELPVTTDMSSRLLRLPVFSEMTMDQVRRVTDAIMAFYEQQTR